MSSALAFTTPREAYRAMVDAGATFNVRHHVGGLGISFSYKVAAGGDALLCREILAAMKARPPISFEAFRAAVQAAASLKEGAA